MEDYKYAIKNVKLRKTIDLTDHENEISKGVSNVFPNVGNSFGVFKEYYEFSLPQKADNNDLRKMGRKIAKGCKELGNKVKRYSYVPEHEGDENRTSCQLFTRLTP